MILLSSRTPCLVGRNDKNDRISRFLVGGKRYIHSGKRSFRAKIECVLENSKLEVTRSCFGGKKVRNLEASSVARHVSSEGSIFLYNSARRPIKLRSDWE